MQFNMFFSKIVYNKMQKIPSDATKLKS